MSELFDLPPHLSLGTVTAGQMVLGSMVLASIWLSNRLIRKDHADILRELRQNTGETVLSKANAFRAANTADRNADLIAAAATEIVSKTEAAVSHGVAQVADTASDVAATLAGQTPTATVVPAGLRLAIADSPRPK